MNQIVKHTVWDDELIQEYGQTKHPYRHMLTSRGEVKADKYAFVINGLAQPAGERDNSGDIVPQPFSQTEVLCNLVEVPVLIETRDFDIETAPSDVRRGMTETVVDSINMATRNLVQETLYGTTNVQSATPITAASMLRWAGKIRQDIGNNTRGKVWMHVSQQAWEGLLQIKEFSSADWNTDKPFAHQMEVNDMLCKDWAGAKWVCNLGLDGHDTSACKMVGFHSSAIGYCMVSGNKEGDPVPNSGYDKKQAKWWVNAIAKHGSTLLHNGNGVHVYTVDES